MTPRRKRLTTVALVLVGVSIATGLALRAFRDNVVLYFTPAEVAQGKASDKRAFRLGGMVLKGSVVRQPGSLTLRFDVTDYIRTITVHYTGVLPDLFREGQGVVVHGSLVNGEFKADEVLAKHDEKYMPRDIAGKIAPPPGVKP
jgi:cytochrome c-type biogenesis protein CcmE